MKFLVRSGGGRLDPFVLVVEGSIPNEKIKKEGYWAGLGTDPTTGQPITTCEWIDRLTPKALAVIACGTCATYGGIHAMEGNPTGCMGLADYLGWGWKSKAGLPIVNVPGFGARRMGGCRFSGWRIYLSWILVGKQRSTRAGPGNDERAQSQPSSWAARCTAARP